MASDDEAVRANIEWQHMLACPECESMAVAPLDPANPRACWVCQTCGEWIPPDQLEQTGERSQTMREDDQPHDQPHEPLDTPVPGGHRYTCALCGAIASIPNVLLAQWQCEGTLQQGIQRELTHALLLRTGHYQ